MGGFVFKYFGDGGVGVILVLEMFGMVVSGLVLVEAGMVLMGGFVYWFGKCWF